MNGAGPRLAAGAKVEDKAGIAHCFTAEASGADLVNGEIFLNFFKEIHGTDLNLASTRRSLFVP